MKSLIVAVVLFLSLQGLSKPGRAAEGTDENLNAVVWTQLSAEYASVALQTFRSAERSLLQALENEHWTAALEQQPGYQNLPTAVIVDLDETILDNSSFQADAIRNDKPYSEAEWEAWVAKERALPIPGAVEFLKLAHVNGVAVFYVTNRVCEAGNAKDHTVVLLKSLNVPFLSSRLRCRTSSADSSEKGPRRANIAASYRVLLLVGDDLNDFVTIPRENERNAQLAIRNWIVQANRRFWGERWFIIPNPMYGSWERAVGMNVEEKLEALRP
jgi:acid phosphatase